MRTAAAARFGRRDPDARGYFGDYGGRFVPETLVEPIEELERAYFTARDDQPFVAEWERLLVNYVGRPTPIYEARRLSQACGGARIFLKREDLTHTGAHKINNALGQALLAQRMGKQRIVAETGAGQHGVASATACALLGLQCCVYMGAVGGAAALIAKSIKKSEVLAWEDLGTEAIRRMEVEEFPAIVIIDADGNDLYKIGREKYKKTA